jgi:hypothetical protein
LAEGQAATENFRFRPHGSLRRAQIAIGFGNSALAEELMIRCVSQLQEIAVLPVSPEKRLAFSKFLIPIDYGA